MIGRRAWCLTVAGAALAAGDELRDWLARLAEYLGEENATDFLKCFDKPLRTGIESNVWAMVKQAELASSVAVLGQTEQNGRIEVELDWYLYLKPLAASGTAEHRRERVKLTLARARKGWLITAMEAGALFNAPR